VNEKEFETRSFKMKKNTRNNTTYTGTCSKKGRPIICNVMV